jgi:hypothetical protein
MLHVFIGGNAGVLVWKTWNNLYKLRAVNKTGAVLIVEAACQPTVLLQMWKFCFASDYYDECSRATYWQWLGSFRGTSPISFVGLQFTSIVSWSLRLSWSFSVQSFVHLNWFCWRACGGVYHDVSYYFKYLRGGAPVKCKVNMSSNSSSWHVYTLYPIDWYPQVAWKANETLLWAVTSSCGTCLYDKNDSLLLSMLKFSERERLITHIWPKRPI